MAEAPIGRYKMGPITDKDVVEEHPVTPGCTLRFLVVGDAAQSNSTAPDGSSLLPDIREVLPLVRDMPVFDDDVFVIAHAKTGSHWTWEIVNMLMKGTTEYENMSKARRQLEFHYPDEFKDMSRPRVFNTHFLLHHLPKQAIEKKCKIIVVQRNPKDTAVSLYYHMKGYGALSADATFADYLSAWLKLESDTTNNWFYYTKKLEEIIYGQTEVPIFNWYYEDLKANPVEEVKRLVKYLAVDRSDEFIEQVVEKCGFHNLKKADEEKVSAIEGLPKEMFSFMYRKGEVGDWKNHFTVAENDHFDKIYNNRMKTCKFTFKYG